MDQYDLIVIGAGPGGYVAAIKAAQLGMKTAIIEKDLLGGTCLNRGCIPTKTLLHTSKLYDKAKNWSDLGLSCDNLDLDLDTLYQRKKNIVTQLRDGIDALLEANKINIINGEAKIISKDTVQVADEQYQSTNILIAAGSCPHSLPIPGCELADVVCSDEILDKPRPYDHLVIIGGGVIGMEFATLYQQMGTKVTVIEAMERILPGLDREIGQNLAMIMKKQGVDIYTKACIDSFNEQEDGSLLCRFSCNDQISEIIADGVLISVGRKGCADELFADNLDVNCINGQINVDKNFCTNIPNIYAVGDIAVGSWQLAHTASASGINAVCHMAGVEPQMDMDTVPGCIFTDPEIAIVGKSENDAKAEGIAIKTSKYLMSGNGKSIIETDRRSFIKLICEEETGRIIGAQLMCAHASDLVNELSLAISKGLTAKDIAHVIHPHPTLSEGIAEAAEGILGMSIHTMPRRR